MALSEFPYSKAQFQLKLFSLESAGDIALAIDLFQDQPADARTGRLPDFFIESPVIEFLGIDYHNAVPGVPNFSSLIFWGKAIYPKLSSRRNCLKWETEVPLRMRPV